VAIPIGHRYARYHVPRYVGAPSTSQNPVALLPAAAEAGGGIQYLGVRVTLAKTGARRPLAVLQATFDQDHRERLARHVELGTAREEALRGRTEAHEVLTMYTGQRYPGYRWGMAVDVDACVGCGACVVACIAENNVPVVGKAEAAYGRQVHWLRLERWLPDEASPRPRTSSCRCSVSTAKSRRASRCVPSLPPIEPKRPQWAGLQPLRRDPLLRQQLPVPRAPVQLVQLRLPEPLEVQLNPDVTVRQLGVMEKCTMCIQRIVAGKDHAHRDEKRPVRDGDISPHASRRVPPARSRSATSRTTAARCRSCSNRRGAYQVLDEIGTRPG